MFSQFTTNKNSVQTRVSLEDKPRLHLPLRAFPVSKLNVRKYAGLINIALYTYIVECAQEHCLLLKFTL